MFLIAYDVKVKLDLRTVMYSKEVLKYFYVSKYLLEVEKSKQHNCLNRNLITLLLREYFLRGFDHSKRFNSQDSFTSQKIVYLFLKGVFFKIKVNSIEKQFTNKKIGTNLLK